MKLNRAYYIDLVKGRRKRALDAPFSFFLLLLSFFYGLLVKLILSCYQTGLLRAFKPACRVISVGNLTWGGTGKTPLVQALAKFLKQEGKNPAVLIRGYGKDEVYLLQNKLKEIPILAGRDRVRNAKEALARYGADVIVLDDGFQHWRLGRDCDIVLIDATCPFGNYRLIPRGILREPLSALSRADILVLTKTDLVGAGEIEAIKKELRKYNVEAPIYEAKHRPAYLLNLISREKLGLTAIRNQQIAVLSGIGNPQSFEQSLSSLGAKVCLRFNFPDHYYYDKDDLKKIEAQCIKTRVETIVTTEKDAVKLGELLKREAVKPKILALGVEFQIAPQQNDAFLRQLKGGNISGPYSILLLSDGKAGHLNQAKAVAKIIQERKLEQGMPSREICTKIVEVKFKNVLFRALLSLCSIFSGNYCRRCLLCLRSCLQKDSFDKLMQTPAQVIVSAGASVSAVNIFLAYKNKARNVGLMKPLFLNLSRFDLVIVPEHDRVRPRENVLATRITPNLIDRQYLQDQAEVLNTKYETRNMTYENKGPTIGILIGGDTPKLELSLGLMEKLTAQLKQAAEELDCRLLITTSRRTPKTVEGLLKDKFAGFPRCRLLVIANEKNIPEAVGGILGSSDIVVVSGESISMVSEAVSAERYLLAFTPDKKARTLTKQEAFLRNLESEGILKIVNTDNLLSEIEKFRKEGPRQNKINDRELLYQRLSKLL